MNIKERKENKTKIRTYFFKIIKYYSIKAQIKWTRNNQNSQIKINHKTKVYKLELVKKNQLKLGKKMVREAKKKLNRKSFG